MFYIKSNATFLDIYLNYFHFKIGNLSFIQLHLISYGGNLICTTCTTATSCTFVLYTSLPEDLYLWRFSILMMLYSVHLKCTSSRIPVKNPSIRIPVVIWEAIAGSNWICGLQQIRLGSVVIPGKPVDNRRFAVTWTCGR